MAHVDGFSAGIGREIDAIAAGNARMGLAEQRALYGISLCIGLRKAEYMFLSFFPLRGSAAFYRTILEAPGRKGLSRLHGFLHGALELLQYGADTRQQDIPLRHIL